MASSNRVHTRSFQDLHLPLGRTPVDSRPQRTEVMVIADSMEFKMAAVEQKSLLPIKRNPADAEGCRVAVYDSATIDHLAQELVEVRMVNIPQLRLFDCKDSGDRCDFSGRDAYLYLAATDKALLWI